MKLLLLLDINWVFDPYSHPHLEQIISISLIIEKYVLIYNIALKKNYKISNLKNEWDIRQRQIASK